jgi:predicted N-acetyltransferase YhbS
MFTDAIIAAEHKHFGREWGNKRIELLGIAADPRYHRRGVGKALMKWGLGEATKQNIPIILTAGPLGTLLYTSVGFKELGRLDCDIEVDQKKSPSLAMIWVPEGFTKPLQEDDNIEKK